MKFPMENVQMECQNEKVEKVKKKEKRCFTYHSIFINIYQYETCRNLQAKVIKTAAFCHNRALQDLFPDSYRLLFTTGSFTSTTSPFSNEPGVQRVQRSNMLEG